MADGAPLGAGDRLTHYRLIERIGAGGMGVVWKARDSVLGRTVAIKVLPPERLLDPQRRQQFLDEARRASTITHPHVARVYELGSEGNLDFIVMEHVEGGSLDGQLLGRALPPERAAQIGLQVARALSETHRRSLVHRDLKPGNILLTTDGEVKLADFGLAVLSEERASTIDSIDETQSVLDASEASGSGRHAVAGSLPYMSPEQLLGQKLDARSDVFSLGVVLYEMATGRRPFVGSHAELAEQICAARPAAPHRLAPGLPVELERIILKSMSRRPSDRYQTMEDLAVDLKHLGRQLETGSSPSYQDLERGLRGPGRRHLRIGIALAGAVAVLAAAALLLWQPFSGGGDAERTVLVFPLDAPGDDGDDRLIGRVLAEALAINLAQAPALRVLPVPGAGELKASGTLDLTASARRLGAGLLLTGTLTRDGPALRASLNLVDTADRRLLWGAQRRADEGQLGEMVSWATAEIAGRLDVELPRVYDWIGNLTGGPEMAASAEAVEAIAALRRGELDGHLAAAERLVLRFPDEPDAWAHLAQASVLKWDADPSPQNLERMERTLDTLSRVAPGNPYSAFWSAYLLNRRGDAETSLARYGELLARADLTPTARAWFTRWRSVVRDSVGDHDGALADLVESLRLDPTNSWTLSLVSIALRRRGQHEEALTHARQAVALAPSHWRHHLVLGNALLASGRSEESIAAYRRGCELSESQYACALQLLSLARAGRVREAPALLERVEGMTEHPEGQYNLACYHALAGDRDRALACLARAIELGFDASGIDTDPDLATLRDDPRFRKLSEGAGS